MCAGVDEKKYITQHHSQVNIHPYHYLYIKESKRISLTKEEGEEQQQQQQQQQHQQQQNLNAPRNRRGSGIATTRAIHKSPAASPSNYHNDSNHDNNDLASTTTSSALARSFPLPSQQHGPGRVHAQHDPPRGTSGFRQREGQTLVDPGRSAVLPPLADVYMSGPLDTLASKPEERGTAQSVRGLGD